MSGAAPVLLFLALQVSAPSEAIPAARPEVRAEVRATPSSIETSDRSQLLRRRRQAVSARLGNGLSAQRAPDDRTDPLVAPAAVLAGFGTIVIDIEVPN